MEGQKLVLQEGTYRYDFETAQVSVSEDELHKAGYMKLADDEQIVKKGELSKEEVEFMECNKHLPFRSEAIDFLSSANTYVNEHTVTLEDDHMMLKRLVQAYFCGYTVRETKYYIKLSFISNSSYLNVYKDDDAWEFGTKRQVYGIRTQFTQTEIDELQKDKQARGLDLNAFKVRVPDNELED